MAIHARNQVRNAIVTKLTGLATTGANIFKSRAFPLDDSVLPALIVYTNRERSENRSLGLPRVQTRTVEVYIEGKGKSAGQIDDVLDQIAKEVEVALAADVTLGHVARDCYLQDTELDLIDGDKNIGQVRLTYIVTYQVLETTPDTIL